MQIAIVMFGRFLEIETGKLDKDEKVEFERRTDTDEEARAPGTRVALGFGSEVSVESGLDDERHS